MVGRLINEEVNIQYRVMLIRAPHKPPVCIFYDEDREKALHEMNKYVRAHGFSFTESEGTFTLRTVDLVKETLTGEELDRKHYHELFDHLDRRREDGET